MNSISWRDPTTTTNNSNNNNNNNKSAIGWFFHCFKHSLYVILDSVQVFSSFAKCFCFLFLYQFKYCVFDFIFSVALKQFFFRFTFNRNNCLPHIGTNQHTNTYWKKRRYIPIRSKIKHWKKTDFVIWFFSYESKQFRLDFSLTFGISVVVVVGCVDFSFYFFTYKFFFVIVSQIIHARWHLLISLQTHTHTIKKQNKQQQRIKKEFM